MSIFKKYNLVPTGNIKQYIIDEFTRANNLEETTRELTKQYNYLSKENDKKQDELNKASLIIEQLKYKYGKATENYNKDLEEKNKQITKTKQDLNKEKEKSNTYQIKIIEQQKEIDDLKIQIKELKKVKKVKMK